MAFIGGAEGENRAMPIYEYYSPDTHRIYSFYAKTLAQAQRLPRCPDDPKARMVKLVSGFAVVGARKGAAESGSGDPVAGTTGGAEGADDPRAEAAMAAMEQEFAGVDEQDPKAMARMMRRMAELAGERLDGPMEEAVRKLEEGADPESLEDEMGGAFGDDAGEEGLPPALPGHEPKQAAERRAARRRRAPPVRDPILHDYE